MTDRAQCCCLKPVCRPDKAFKLHLAIRCTMPDATLSRLIMPTSSMPCVGRIRRLRRIRQASVMECTNGLFNSSLSGIAGIARDIRPQLAAPVFIVVGGWLGVLAWGWLWLMIFLPLLNGVGLAYALWLMFKRPSLASRLVAAFSVISVILMLALYYAFLTMPPFPPQR